MRKLKMKVLITEGFEKEGLEYLASEGFEYDNKKGISPEDLLKEIHFYDALIIRGKTNVTKEVIDAGAEKLKIIGRSGAGVNNIDLSYAAEKGVIVKNAPHGVTIPVSELTFGLISALSRKIISASNSMKEGIWDKSNGKELYEKTLGIIGCGRIGQRVARMAKHGYEMRVIGHDSKPNYESGIDFVSLDELLEKSDYISMHIPKEKGKPPVISSNELNKMKKTAYLIDVSRGGNVDETALYNALSSKIIAGAARDVHDLEDSKFTEAYKTNPEKFPLLGLENFIPTPHLGASTEEGQKMIGLEMAEVIVGYLKKGDLTNAVNLGVEKEKEAQRYIVSIHYEDMPGVFGKIGTIFGKYNINIDKHPIGPLKEGSKIINYFVESPVDEKIISEIKAIKGIYSVRV